MATTIAGMDELFERAEGEGLWFFTPYQGMWFSPAELRACHAEGRFRWGSANWQLRNPREWVEEAEAAVRAAEQHLMVVRARVRVSEVAVNEEPEPHLHIVDDTDVDQSGGFGGF